MRAGRLAAAAVFLVLVLAGGWLILERVAQQRLDSAIAQTRASLGPDGRLTYASARAAPFRLGADFTGVRIQNDVGTLRVERLSLSHVGNHSVGAAALRDVTLDAVGVTLHADRLLFRRVPDDDGGYRQDLTAWHLGLVQDGTETVTVAQTRMHTTLSRGSIDSSLAASGLVVTGQSAIGRALAQFGYGGVHGSAQGTWHYDPGAGSLAFGPLATSLDGVGTLTLSLGLARLPASWPTDALALLPTRLSGLSLTYVDAGLAGHVFATLAQRSGVSETQYRDSLVTSLQSRADSVPPGAAHDVQQQAVRFIKDPRRLTITMRPPAPLPLLTLALLHQMQPEAIAHSTGLSVKAD